ncbi:hypothetical protein F5884DRAFT_665764 [Xylogone sp. PMI_703]|nr:hypothetical protein F5884DRAFT_665764 [Xylogone sp. PMI_703]
MSSSPSEPENAASVAESVRSGPAQLDIHKSPDDGQSQDRTTTLRWTPPSRSSSNPTSLLTQGLNNRPVSVPAVPSDIPEPGTTLSSSVPRKPSVPSLQPPPSSLFTLPEEDSQHDGVYKLEPQDAPSNMAMVAPAPAGDVGPHRVDAPQNGMSSEVNMHDMAHFNTLLSNHQDLLTRARGRGTSLERTEKEKRVPLTPQRSYSLNPGDTGMSHSPIIPLSPEGESISNNPPVEGVRASYRSWRDVRPGVSAEKAWSIGGQGGDDSEGGQVERSITEALAGVEPNSRSRKASHSLRFFKEGLPEDSSRKKDKHRGRSKESTSHGPRASLDLHSHHDSDHPPTLSSSRTSSRPSALPSPIDPIDIWPGDVSKTGTAIQQSLNPTEGLAPEGEYYDPSNTIETIPENQLKTMPPQLLEEIRRFHNLTPGAGKGSSFSKSIPLTQAEKLKSPNEEQQDREDKDSDGAELSPVKSCDDDESGEEHISSALFVPHQTSPDREDDEENIAGASRKSSDSQQWLEKHEVLPQEVDDEHANEELKGRAQPQSTRLEKPPQADYEGYFPDTASTDQESHDDTGYTTRGEESNFTDDPDLTPTESFKQGATFPNALKREVRDRQQKRKRPLEAIELIPYKHQVGGHTTMWRFSKRAVCKQLNNRENEFYEKVEQYHPQLLKFLPRYIGVLNVTFEKQQRRKASSKKDVAETPAELKQDKEEISGGSQDNHVDSSAVAENTIVDQPTESRRVISQSLQSSSVPIPKVTFADNRHIIPTSLLQPPVPFLDLQRSKSDVTSLSTNRHARTQSLKDDNPLNRPSLSEKHAVSWGATTVNKKLRNEVFGEAFLQQPIPIHRHKRPASQHRTLGKKKHSLRASSSDPNLKPAKQDVDGSGEKSIRRQAIETAAERKNLIAPLTSINGHASDEEGELEFDGKAGTSAPEPEIARSSSPKGRRPRRYSSGGLRRKPVDDGQSRGNLKYFEEADDAGYKGDVEDVFHMDADASNHQKEVSPSKEPTNMPTENAHDSLHSAPTDIEQGTMLPASAIPPPLLDSHRPVNPKEAQTHRDSRVEYFLLLEDLTAGMKRPCIMDLKMGTRQYGVDANEKKQKSQQKKCAETTSRELGVRVCGLQVWDSKTQSYIFQDKYFGRDLKAGRQFQDALTRFLYDGVDYSSVLRHIPTIIRKLSELEIIIRSLTGYRFYAASLLMFYDGDAGGEYESDSAPIEREPKGTRKEIDFKIADFANCITKENISSTEKPCPPRHPDLPDTGFLRGLRSLRKYFLAIQKEIQAKEMDKYDPEKRNGLLSADLLAEDEEDEGGISY